MNQLELMRMRMKMLNKKKKQPESVNESPAPNQEPSCTVQQPIINKHNSNDLLPQQQSVLNAQTPTFQKFQPFSTPLSPQQKNIPPQNQQVQQLKLPSIPDIEIIPQQEKQPAKLIMEPVAQQQPQKQKQEKMANLDELRKRLLKMRKNQIHSNIQSHHENANISEQRKQDNIEEQPIIEQKQLDRQSEQDIGSVQEKPENEQDKDIPEIEINQQIQSVPSQKNRPFSRVPPIHNKKLAKNNKILIKELYHLQNNINTLNALLSNQSAGISSFPKQITLEQSRNIQQKLGSQVQMMLCYSEKLKRILGNGMI